MLQQLPAVLIVGVVVAVLAAVQRRHSTSRMRWWLLAWGMLFLHFLAHFALQAQFQSAALMRAAGIVDRGAQVLAAVAFLVSVSSVWDLPGRRIILAALLGLPSFVYAALWVWPVQAAWPYAAAVLVLLIGGVAWMLPLARTRQSHIAPLTALLIAAGCWSLYSIWHNDFRFGLLAILFSIFIATGVLLLRVYRRWTPGVLTTAVGFFAWAGIYIFAAAWQETLAAIGANHEIWNVPRYVVGLGMIVMMLEEISSAEQQAREREHILNLQLERFGEVTSRLLSLGDIKPLCGQIASVITETTNFRRVVILLADEHRSLYVAGHSGMPPQHLRLIEQSVGKLSDTTVESMCARGHKIGNNSFICRREQLEPVTTFTKPPQYMQKVQGPEWREGDEVLVPLRSPRGAFMGCISLDEPKEVARLNRQEMSKIELLAADIAVAMENAALQKQLLRTEKLAGLGQLVAGVAHELNNPLTAVLGYAEVLHDTATDERARRDLTIIQRESMRMKRIIEDLLRFARHNKPERTSVHLEPVLREVLRLCQYEINERKADVAVELPPELPPVAIDENQMKQVFFNLLKNALDAVDGSIRREVRVDAFAQSERVHVRFIDSGRGFADIDRVFDPFYTTKSVGKGTGLGLSVCYGILKEYGGDIEVRNLEQGGACVTIELPLAGVADPTPSKAGVSS